MERVVGSSWKVDKITTRPLTMTIQAVIRWKPFKSRSNRFA